MERDTNTINQIETSIVVAAIIEVVTLIISTVVALKETIVIIALLIAASIKETSIVTGIDTEIVFIKD